MSDIFSERLTGLLDDVLEGRAPNAGRFCARCYHPLTGEAPTCPHCGAATVTEPPVARIPDEVFAMYRAQRSREGLVVRSIAWGGLTAGVILGLMPLAFYNVTWWSVVAFFGIMALFYVGSANLANSIGDSLGYRWGQSELRRRWTAFQRGREG
jgi:rRNA maturation protein Nop10